MTLPLMIFAAGFGTRMGALTRDRPKPLIPVAGRPLMDHALSLAKDARCDPVVVNAHYRADMLVDYLAGQDVTTLIEHPDILETGGGLRNALPLLGADTVLTLNSDAVWAGPNPLPALIAAWDPARMDALLMCVPVERTWGYEGAGDFTLQSDGQIRRGPGVRYTGAQILKPDRLHDVADPVFSLNVVWNDMNTDGRLFGLEYDGSWCDVGHPSGIDAAEEMLKSVDV